MATGVQGHSVHPPITESMLNPSKYPTTLGKRPYKEEHETNITEILNELVGSLDWLVYPSTKCLLFTVVFSLPLLFGALQSGRSDHLTKTVESRDTSEPRSV